MKDLGIYVDPAMGKVFVGTGMVDEGYMDGV
jgi:hypothetical protein